MARRRQFLTEAEIAADIEQFLYDDDNDNESDEGDDLDRLYGNEADIGDDEYDIGVGDINVGDDIGVEEEIVPPVRQRRPKKKLTANRLVNSIDNALTLDNYDPLVLPDANFETVTGCLGPKSMATTQKIFWTNEPYTPVGRQRACDVITGNVSAIRRNTKRADSIRDAFELFMNEDMITLIVHKTNLKIDEVIEKLPEATKSNSKYSYIKQTDAVEIYALLGLMYFRGLLGMNNHSYDVLFSEKAGPAVFGATMSRNRFKFLVANIMFDDHREREVNWPQGRFAAARVLFMMFNNDLEPPPPPLGRKRNFWFFKNGHISRFDIHRSKILFFT